MLFSDLPDRHPDRHRVIHPVQKTACSQKAEALFVMELPPYRIPTTRNVVRHMWSKGSQYLRKWNGHPGCVNHHLGPGYYPRNGNIPVDYDRVAAEIASSRPVARRRASKTAGTERHPPCRTPKSSPISEKIEQPMSRRIPAARLRLADRNQPVQRTGGQARRRQYDGRRATKGTTTLRWPRTCKNRYTREATRRDNRSTPPLVARHTLMLFTSCFTSPASRPS